MPQSGDFCTGCVNIGRIQSNAEMQGQYYLPRQYNPAGGEGDPGASMYQKSKKGSNNIIYLCNPRYRYKFHAWFTVGSLMVWGGTCRRFKMPW